MAARRWTTISADPNSTEALSYRRAVLKAARRPPVPSRNEFFASMAAGKRVLDVGCVDHLAPGVAIAPLHKRLAPQATELVGVDIAEEGVAELRSRGYDVEVVDVTEPGLADIVGDGFDLVTAGEILEHLLDLTVFLRNVAEVLRDDGRLVVSTPNPHSLHLIYRNMVGRPVDNVDHVVYHWPSGVAEMAERCGFELLEVRGERRMFRRSIPSFLIGRVISALAPAANAECITMLYVLRPVR